MSRWHLERAIFLLGHDGPATRYDTPAAALQALVERGACGERAGRDVPVSGVPP